MATASQPAVAGAGTRRAYPWMRYRPLYLAWLALVVAVAAASAAGHGFEWGIDFTGGTLLERAFPRPVTAQEVRTVLTSPALAELGLGGSAVQPSGDGRVVFIRTRPLDQPAIRRVDEALAAQLGGLQQGLSRTEVVGPVVGRELVRQALLALALATGGILVYVTLRFEHRFGISAVAALLHDALVMVALFSLAGLEVNVAAVAAVLTVLGYSVNDTIVVFDRIREHLRARTGGGRRVDYARLAEEAVMQTLPRTLNTAGTTLVVAAAVLSLGGATLRDFMLALLVGIASGTFSSIFVATALWVTWRSWEARRRGARPAAP